jgi:Lar family restriction alleviation protein
LSPAMVINRRDCNNMPRNPTKAAGDAGVPFSGQPLPCPFCGGSDFWLHSDIHPKFVACKKCSAFGPTAPTVSQAIERWNIRQGGEHLFKVHSYGNEASAMRADSDIRRDVEDELWWDPDIDATDIAVTVRNGVVTLAGFVRSYMQKYQAESDAKRVAGVVAVANDIQIRLPDVDERPDPEIARDAVARIKGELPWDNIRVIVKDGWLTLEGEVEWNYQRERAEEAARRVRGMKGITNSIEVKPRATPMEIRRKIEEALRRAAELDANRITVETNGGEVILRGTVRSWAERQEAERAAWLAPGVAKMDNRISINP